MAVSSIALSADAARGHWLAAQRLDQVAPFGSGPTATAAAVQHLGYVQIDTINVIERCHHHILFTRIPEYQRADLTAAQSRDKSVFEYWTHALAYVPTPDYRYYIPAMDRRRAQPTDWIAGVDEKDYKALLARIRREGALSIRDIDDEVLVEKTHPWASRKPSKRALRFGFFVGDLSISGRAGMVKSYELTNRHFGWRRRPAPASEQQIAAFLLERALRAQGIVSLDSICYGETRAKGPVSALLETAVRRKRLVPVHLPGFERVPHWTAPATLDRSPALAVAPRLLSPFDPLVIQRRRLAMFFGYDHRFEAYVPAAKRVLGYFALPVLVGNEIVAAIDLKTDRQAGRLTLQKWTWMVAERAGLKAMIEEELGRFERFQTTTASGADGGEHGEQ
jgi:hypothetical protein